MVTGECLLIREEVLAKLLAGRKLNGSVPGLEEASAESWNLQELDREGWNIELCLKTQLLGLRNIYTPFAVLELRGAEREVPGYADYLVVHRNDGPKHWMPVTRRTTAIFPWREAAGCAGEAGFPGDGEK